MQQRTSVRSLPNDRYGRKRAKVRSGDIEYSLIGSGPVVLALHGTPGGLDQALLLFESLALNGFSVLAPSRPGFLGTPLAAARSFQEQAALMVELIDSLGIDQFMIAAFSAGGPCASEIAARHKYRVKGLILEAAVTKPFISNKRQGLPNMLIRTAMGSLVLEWFMDHFPEQTIEGLVKLERAGDTAQIQEESRMILNDAVKLRYAFSFLDQALPASARRAGFLNDLEQLAAWKGERLSEISCPTLIIHGKADADVTIDHAEYASSEIKQSEFFEVPNGGHLLPLCDQWSEVQETRIRFLNSIKCA